MSGELLEDRITAMPGCSIAVMDDEVEVGWDDGRLCAEHPDQPANGHDCPDPHLLITQHHAGNDVHLAALVGYCVDQVHEAIEWIKFDGNRFADPHPDHDEMAAWDLLAAGIVRVLRDYREHFPASPSLPTDRLGGGGDSHEPPGS